MKKIANRFTLVSIGVMVILLLSGCGKITPEAYLQALLDNTYKNDSAVLVELGIATAEEAELIFEKGLETMKNSLAQADVLSEDEADIFQAVIVEMLANAKYKVGEAKKQEDGSYVVTVTYEQMNIYGPSTEAYMAQVEMLVTDWTEAALTGEDIPEEDEMITKMLEGYKEILEDTLANVTYKEPQTTTVRIELLDKNYQPNADDMKQLHYLLYDNEAATE